MINKKTFFSILLLLFIVIFTHHAWFIGLPVIIGSDWGFFYPETMKEWFPIHSIWNPQLNFGYYDFVSVPFLLPYFLRGVLAVSHIDFVIIDRLLYLYPVALLAPIGMFFLCKKLTNNVLASLFGAILYTLNTYFLTLQIGHFTLSLVYALFPFIFLLLHVFLKTPKYSYLVSIVFLLFIAFSNEARITFIVFLLLLSYAIFSLIFIRRAYTKSKIVSIVKYLVLGSIIFIGLLTFFTFPLLIVRDIGIGDVAGRGFFGADFFPLQNALTLFHPFWNGTITTEFIPQPIPFYFWIFPLIAFSSLFFLKKNKMILFFALVAVVGIFLSKGITEPFGQIYTYLYFNVPGFNFFREPSKFYFLIALSYSVLFAFFITYFSEFLVKRFKNKFTRFIGLSLVIIPLIGLFSLIAKPVVEETLGQAFHGTTVPQEYSVLKDFLLKQEDFFRTMYVPNRQRFEVLTANHPSLSYFGISDDLRTLDPNILKLFSVKYVILPLDSTNDVYRHYGPRTIWEAKIEQNKDFKQIENSSLGDISVYENTKGALPHIYVADNTVYVEANQSLLNPLFSLLPEKKNFLYFSKSLQNLQKTQAITDFDQYYNIATCIQCDEEIPWENFPFPYAKILPDSPIYAFIKYKEQKRLKSLMADKTIYHAEVAFYSLKRIVEVQKIMEEKLHREYLTRTIVDNTELLNTLSSYVDTLPNQNLENNDTLRKLEDYISIEKKLIGDLMYGQEADYGLRSIFQNHYYLLDALRFKIHQKIWESTDVIKKYSVDFPKDTTSEILVKNNQTLQPLSLEIDDAIYSPTVVSDEWLSFGEKTFVKGKHKIAAVMGEKVNLVATSSGTFIVNNTEGLKKIQIPIANFHDGQRVSIHFSYQVSGGKPVRFFLSQDADRVINGNEEVELDKFFIFDDTWHNEDTIIKPKIGSTKANLEFWLEADGRQDAVITIKDITVHSAINPLIVFKTENKVQADKSPSVSIKTLSPTHYQAKITGANKPFMLIFNEQFHNGWKATIEHEQIAEKDHSEANGYANAWNINKNGNYTVDINFSPQKYYTIGIFISLGILLVILLSLVYSLLRKNEKKK